MKKTLHETVLIQESINSLKIKKDGIYVDGTFGAGGHSLKILKKLNQNGKLYSIDKDPQAIKIAKKIKDSRFNIIHGNFSDIDKYAHKYHILQKIDGIILDLGISYMQITSKNRGFSFKYNGPLDMRMNPTLGISACEWINTTDKKTIKNVLKYFGEERFAQKIANKIIQYRKNKTISTTHQLSEIIKNIIPKKKKHPATKSFQAIRIFINQELYEIQIFLKKILKLLKYKGRISIISFNSLEDRLIKQFMFKNSQYPFIPPEIPLTEKQIKKLYSPKLKIINKIFPSIKEIQKNPKSRSAILRTAELKKY